jgi:cell division protease FtsH
MNPIATLSQRNAQLEQVADQLKTEFVGLDAIIDRIINLMRSWYLIPEIQQRPQVINLWGMTGVGKTSLIDRLIELLDLEDRYKRVNMGKDEHRNPVERALSDTYDHFHEQPFVLALDEFQHARTLDKMGMEKDEDRSTLLWELLGSGSIDVDRLSFFSRGQFSEYITELVQLLRLGMKVEDGLVVEGQELFEEHADIMYQASRALIEEENTIPFIDEGQLDDLMDIHSERFADKFELKEHLLTLNGPQTIEFLQDALLQSYKPYRLDCSQAIIFVIGNIDELYQMHADQNPDQNADQFHDMSTKIEVGDVKSALQDYFRNEQLARLGNNHVIYPAFTEQNYKEIISMELDQLSDHTMEHFNLPMTFAQEVHDLIYREGVYPSQGTRPVFSTIYQLVESKLGRIICEPYLQELLPDRVHLGVEEQQLVASYMRDNESVLKLRIALELNLEQKRKSEADDFQALMAVHESGHAIAQIWLRGRIPDSVISQKLTGDPGGQTVSFDHDTFFTRKSMINAAAMLLGGYTAERLIFGEEHVSSGSGSDIQRATGLLGQLIRHAGMGSRRANMDNPGSDETGTVIDQHHELNDEVKSLLEKAERKAEQLLREREDELMTLANYLSDHRRISKQEIIDLLEINPDELEDTAHPYRKIVKQRSGSHLHRANTDLVASNGMAG